METLKRIGIIAKIIKEKPEESRAVIENIRNTENARKNSGARNFEDGDETEEDMAEIESELNNLQSNPNTALYSIATEYQGDEKIALMEIMYTGGSYQQFSERYSHLGVNLEEQFPPVEGYNTLTNQNSRLNTSNCADCKLHVAAGASIVLFAAGVAYLVIPRLSIVWKAATLLAVGLAAGIVAGAIKEYADYVRNKQNQGNPNYASHQTEFKDILFTGVGGLLGSAVVYGGMNVIKKKPLLLGAALTGMSIFVGTTVIKCCVFNKCAC